MSRCYTQITLAGVRRLHQLFGGKGVDQRDGPSTWKRPSYLRSFVIAEPARIDRCYFYIFCLEKRTAVGWGQLEHAAFIWKHSLSF